MDFHDTTMWDVLRWFALYTRGRHEKVVDQELRQKGIETFLPLRKISRRWSDRTKLIEEPLFKGYVFVRAGLRDRLSILKSRGVVRFVEAADKRPVEVPERELAAVRRFVEEEMSVDPFPYLKEGEKVYIRSGPLKGAEGFIFRKFKKVPPKTIRKKMNNDRFHF